MKEWTNYFNNDYTILSERISLYPELSFKVKNINSFSFKNSPISSKKEGNTKRNVNQFKNDTETSMINERIENNYTNDISNIDYERNDFQYDHYNNKYNQSKGKTKTKNKKLNVPLYRKYINTGIGMNDCNSYMKIYMKMSKRQFI